MRSSLLFWLSVPFLLPQGLYVRATAPRFDGAAGAARGRIGEGPELRLTGFGDSIIAGVGARDFGAALIGRTAAALAASLERSVAWSAHGFIGANSAALLDEHLPPIELEATDVFLLSVGVNDVTSLTGLRRWRRNLETLILRLDAASPGAVIAFAGLPPMERFPLLPQPLRTALGARARALDAVLREVASRQEAVIHVPVAIDAAPRRFAPDGYHPGEESYVEFGRSMAAPIAAALRAR